MASNKEKLIAAAQKLVEKGQYDKAVKEYLKVVAEDASDVRIWLKIGDLYAKLGKNREAADTYQRVAQFYSDKGHYLKAVAVYKQIIKIDPRLVEIHQRLAEMYKQLGLLSDAMQQYELVAAHFHKEGKPKEALAALKQIVELDPENIASRIKLAELYSKEQMSREAVDEFSRAAEYLHDHKRLDDYMKVAERLLFFAPENRPVSRELARLYISRGDPRRALPKLQVVLKADPHDVEALGLLATAFEVMGQNGKCCAVLKELAKIHQENGSKAEREEVYRKILSLEPQDPEALSAIGKLPAPPAAPEDTAPPHGASEWSAPTGPSGATFLDDAAEEPTNSEMGEEEIGKILTETDVYIKYGLHQKAIEHVNKIFARVPDHLEAHEKLKAIYVALGQIDDAITELFRLANLCGRTPRGEEYLREILELDPGNVRARQLLSAGSSGPTPGPARLSPVPLRTVHDVGASALQSDEHLAAADAGGEAIEDIEEIGADEVLDLDDAAVVEEQDPYAEAIDAAIAADDAGDLPATAALDGTPVVAFADVENTFDGSALPPEEPILDESPHLPSLAEDSREHATSGGRPMNVLRGARAEVIHTHEAELPEQKASDARPEGGSLEDDLDEADFFIQQNLFDEAREILNGLLGRYPGHPLVTAKLRDIDAAEGVAAAPAAEEAPVAEADDVGRPTLTGDELDSSAYAAMVAQAAEAEEHPPIVTPEPTAALSSGEFNAVRKNVVEKGVGAEDFETHYDLGIAYKEMGLLDDAIAEFHIVMQDPAREVQCHMMLGLCYTEKGLMTDAISQFKEGLYAERIQEREQLALYYELGQAYERLNDVREALYYYEKVSKRDAGFRDVDARIQAMRGAAPPPPALTVGEGDVESAFDGMLSDAPAVNEARGGK